MEDNAWSLEDMKQNLSLLKKALISEREEKKKVKSELLKIQEIVLKAEENLKDKVKFI